MEPYGFITARDLRRLSRHEWLTLQMRLTMLYQQLSKTQPVDFHHMKKACAEPNRALLAYAPSAQGRLSEVVGIGSLVAVCTPRDMTGRIEDVVVDREYRGLKIGAGIVGRLLEEGERIGMKTIYLTSKPERIEANALYKKLGFKQYETNNYRHRIE